MSRTSRPSSHRGSLLFPGSSPLQSPSHANNSHSNMTLNIDEPDLSALRGSLRFSSSSARSSSFSDYSSIHELIASTMTPEKIIQRIIDVCAHVCCVELMSVWLHQKDQHCLVCLYSKQAGLASHQLRECLSVGRRVSDERGLLGIILNGGDAMLINEAVSSDWRYCAETDERPPFSLRRILSVPVRSADGRTIAVLEAVNSTKEGGFTQQDILFIKSMAASASSILRKQEILNSLALRRRQAEAQQYISSLMASAASEMSQAKAIEVIEDIGKRITGAKAVNVWLLDKDGHFLGCSKRTQSDKSPHKSWTDSANYNHIINNTNNNNNGKLRVGEGNVGLVCLKSGQELAYYMNEDQQFCLSAPIKTSVGGPLAVIECIEKIHDSDISLTKTGNANNSNNNTPVTAYDRLADRGDDSLDRLTRDAAGPQRYTLEELSQLLSKFNVSDPDTILLAHSRSTLLQTQLASSSNSFSSSSFSFDPPRAARSNAAMLNITVNNSGVFFHSLNESAASQYSSSLLSDASAPPQPAIRTFTRDDIFLLHSLAESASIVLRNSQLHDETRSRARQTASLLHIIELMSSDSMATHLIVQRIIDTAYKLVNCERITLFMVQEKGDTIGPTTGAAAASGSVALDEKTSESFSPPSMNRLPSKNLRLSRENSSRDDSVKPPAGDLSRTKELVCVVSKDESMRGRRVMFGSGLVGTCGLTQKSINIPDAYEDHRFNNEADLKTNFRTRSLLTVPVVDADGLLVAVIQACNRREDGHNKGAEYFSPEDAQLLESLANSSGIMFTKARMLAATVQAEKKSRALLDLLKVVSSDDYLPLYEVLDGIVNVTYDVIDCDRVTMYFVEAKELFSIVSRDVTGVRFPIGQGIAGYVALSGQAVRIADAYKEKQFDKSVDLKTGYRTQSVLCRPIKDHDGKVLAVIQLLNKKLDPRDLRTGASSLFAGPANNNNNNNGQRSDDGGDSSSGGTFGSFTQDDEEILGAICDQISDCIRKHMSEALQIHYASNPRVTSLIGLYMQTARGQTPVPPSPLFPGSRSVSFQSSLNNSVLPSRIHSTAHTRKSSTDSTISNLALPPSQYLSSPKAGQSGPQHMAANLSYHTGVSSSSSSSTSSSSSSAHSPPGSPKRRPLPTLQRPNANAPSPIHVDDTQQRDQLLQSQKFGFYDRRKVSASFQQIFQFMNTIGGGVGVQSPSRAVPSPQKCNSPVLPTYMRDREGGPGPHQGSPHRPPRALTMSSSASDVIIPLQQSPTQPTAAAAVDATRFVEFFHWSQPFDHRSLFFDDANRSPRQRPAFALSPDLLPVNGLFIPRSLHEISSLQLQELDDVNFDVFSYERNELLYAVAAMFHYAGLLSMFAIDLPRFQAFLLAVHDQYTAANPFHNFYHGVACLHFNFLLLRQSNAMAFLTNLHVFSLFISSLCHDISHPGNTNDFEINSESPLALTYSDLSVLENHHAYTTFTILRQPATCILAHLDVNDRRFMRSVIIHSILATDMSTAHFPIIKRLSIIKDSSSFSPDNEADRLFICALLIHTSDISGRVLPFFLCSQWEARIVLEFTAQSQREAAMGLPSVDFMNNLDNPQIRYQQQVDFLQFVLGPWFQQMARLFSGLQVYYEQLLKNKEKYGVLAKDAAMKIAQQQPAAAKHS